MKRRPINLNFLTIHFPITAWVSIIHRLSGLFLFLVIPILLWMLQESLASEQHLIHLKSILQTPIIHSTLWIILMALLYHCVAGIRHLLMDIHIGESKKRGKIGAWLVMGIFIILFSLTGYFLWW